MEADEKPFERIEPAKPSGKSQTELAYDCIIAVALGVNPTWDNVRALCDEFMKRKEQLRRKKAS